MSLPSACRLTHRSLLLRRSCLSQRSFTTSTRRSALSRNKVVDESTLAGAQHRPSLSGPSLGHLISELSATRPGMEHLRKEGETIAEEDRTSARHIALALMGVPVAIGTVVVGVRWILKEPQADL
ncbi:hypothetical protein LTR28_009348 [Elasticomyces elasticus]|nr:hypothetical protein LTR28_009348 [Elasticomyces elasticus]